MGVPTYFSFPHGVALCDLFVGVVVQKEVEAGVILPSDHHLLPLVNLLNGLPEQLQFEDWIEFVVGEFVQWFIGQKIAHLKVADHHQPNGQQLVEDCLD